VCARDGTEAVQLAAQLRPAVILMDLRMPGLSGSEAMHQIRGNPAFAQVPIVALTAHALQQERDAALAEGFDAVISKPCLPDELLRAVLALLSSDLTDDVEGT
jgi:CheY-like chemotaxis protein